MTAVTDEEVRLVVIALLTGVSVQELIVLRWDEIDLDAGAIHLGGEAARAIPSMSRCAAIILKKSHQRADGGEAVLHDRRGGRLSIEEIGSLVFYATDDAGLDHSHEVTPDMLRCT
ncbi:MAG: site-specific integrase [Stellaceae bacterium]